MGLKFERFEARSMESANGDNDMELDVDAFLRQLSRFMSDTPARRQMVQ